MAKLVFGGIEEEIVTREEFPLEKAREVLKDEVVAVLGYGVQGPAQAMNMRENGINVIVGQRTGTASWDKAIEDGWVPGETLFSLTDAAKRGTMIQYPRLGCRAKIAVARDQSMPQPRRRAVFFAWLFHRLQRPNRRYSPGRC